MDDVIRLKTRKKAALLDAMMQALAGTNSRISFEGTLHNTGLSKVEGAVESESSVLKRATTQPKLDYLVLPLTEVTVPLIKGAITSKVGFGNDGIIHVQIQKGGELAFAAFDGFHEDTVMVSSQFPEQILQQMVEAGILRSYQRVPK